MKRVCIILPGLSGTPIGGYRIVYSYANHLVSDGYAVTVCHLPWPASDDAASDRPDFARFRQRARQWTRLKRRRTQRPTWFPLDSRVRVKNVTRATPKMIPRCDVLVATSVRTAPLVAAAVKAQGSRGVYFIQHFEDWDAPSEFVETTWRLPLKRIVIAPWLEQKGHELSVSTSLVLNAIDPVDMPSGPPIRERSCDVLALVSAHTWKRTDLVTAVLTKLASEVDDFHGVTFGTCPRPPGLPETVEHVEDPDRETLRGLYQNCRVYLCASDAEGWHLPPAEAMASGAAVVSTDIEGVRVYAETTAVFARVGDADHLTRSIGSLLKDPEQCQVVASRGQAAILARTPEAAAAEFSRALFSDA